MYVLFFLYRSVTIHIDSHIMLEGSWYRGYGPICRASLAQNEIQIAGQAAGGRIPSQENQISIWPVQIKEGFRE